MKNDYSTNVKKNYIYNLIYQIFIFIIPLLTTPYVSRTLSADGIGAYSYTSSVVTYFVLLGNLGIATYGQLQIAQNRDNKYKVTKLFWSIFLARLITMMISSILYITYIINTSNFKYLYIVSFSQIVASSIDISWFLQGLEEFKKIVIRNTLIKLISIILIFLLVTQKDDIYIYILILNVSTIIGNISIWSFISKYLEKIKLKDIHIIEHIKFSLVYFIPTVATSIYTVLDKSMIGLITNSTYENGWYEQAHRIELMAVTIVTSLTVVTLPRMAYLYNEKRINEMKIQLSNSLRFILFISIPMTFGLMSISSNLIPWFLGDGYEKSIILLRIFSLLIVIVGLNNAIGKQILMAVGRQKKYNIAVIIGAVLNVLVNIILIPRYKSIGAAISSVLAELSILIIFIYYSKDFIKLKEIIILSKNYIVSGIIMGISVYISCRFFNSNFFALLSQVFIGLTIYISILILIRDSFVINLCNNIFIKMKKFANYISDNK